MAANGDERHDEAVNPKPASTLPCGILRHLTQRCNGSRSLRAADVRVLDDLRVDGSMGAQHLLERFGLAAGHLQAQRLDLGAHVGQVHDAVDVVGELLRHRRERGGGSIDSRCGRAVALSNTR